MGKCRGIERRSELAAEEEQPRAMVTSQTREEQEQQWKGRIAEAGEGAGQWTNQMREGGNRGGEGGAGAAGEG
ncbi:unnamed protein product [Closterium sp. Naga37s-1]|nr:unnamed protein product [Closterium sp. Naga37s-1]